MSSQNASSWVAMTDVGLANEMGSGKVRWRTVQANMKGALVSGTGANITALAVSSESEWMAFGRRGVGVVLLKLQGGSGAEVVLPMSGSGMSGVVTAIHIHKTGSGSGSKSSSPLGFVVYAGDDHGCLVSWHFKDEHTTIANAHVIATELGGITAILAQHSSLFVAVKDGTRVSHVSVTSGRSQEDFPQCPSPPIRSLHLAHHINSLVITSQHRHLAVYSLSESGSPSSGSGSGSGSGSATLTSSSSSLANSNNIPVQYLSSESPSVRVDVSSHVYEQEYQHILGVTELGEVAIWKVSSHATSKKPLQPQCRIKIDTASSSSATKGHSIISAAFSTSKRGVVIVAYGTLAKPFFTELTYIDDATGVFQPKLSIASSDRNNALLDGPGGPASSTIPSATGQASANGKDGSGKSSKEEAKSNKLVGAMDAPIARSTFKGASSASASMMNVDPSSYPQDAADIPFSQLVKQQSKLTAASTTASASTTSSASSAAASNNNSSSTLDLPRATSAVAALVAALSTNDKSQLNLILSKHDEQFITSTLRQLPVSQVLPLLSALLSSFTVKASIPIIAWTRHLLILHQSYLASAPDLINKLSGLYNTVDERLKSFPELLKLSGRFDLLLAHLRDDDESEAMGKRALQTYVEEDDDIDMPDYEEEEDDDDEDDEEHDGSEQGSGEEDDEGTDSEESSD